MTRDEILKDLEGRFKRHIISVLDKSPARVYMEIRPESLVEVAGYIFENLGARFNIASGSDFRRHTEILYHFTFEKINLVISLRVKLPKEKPEIDSLSPVFEGANWIEREMHELLGINFRGHPDLRRLLLPEDWPSGVFPLKKEYEEWDEKAVRNRGV